MRPKKPIDPARRALKNQGYRIGWLIALAGIITGFIWIAIKS